MNRLHDFLTEERNQRLREEARQERLAQDAQRQTAPRRNLFQRLSNQASQPNRSQS